MLVSHRKRFIFTKTVKTAGTSVESYFEPWCMPEGSWQRSHGREEHVSAAGIVGYRGSDPRGATWVNHMSAERMRELLGSQVWDDYFKFTVIRNPFDKMVSGFYRHEHQRHHPDLQHRMRDPSTQVPAAADDDGARSEIDRFRSWVRSSGPIRDRNKYMIDNRECVDCFIRFERLHEDIAAVCERLSIAYVAADLPAFKTGIRPRAIPLRDYYDAATADIVRGFYAWELERFGYQLPASDW